MRIFSGVRLVLLFTRAPTHRMLTPFQEEPLNNGAWTYVGTRILTAANETQHHKGKYPYYAGRNPTSSVATGSKASTK